MSAVYKQLFEAVFLELHPKDYKCRKSRNFIQSSYANLIENVWELMKTMLKGKKIKQTKNLKKSFE